MANIPLKSIKFPDLADTYTVPSNAGELPYNKSATYPADTVGKALQDKPDADGTIANAEQLTSNIYEEDNIPYNFRTSGGSIDIGDRETDMVVGGTVAWNQLVDTGMTSVTVTSGHKYRARINSVESIGASTGTAISLNDATKDNVTDLTQMLGSTIADYIYSLETATAGAGVAWFKKLFPKPYYEYNAGELMSVNASSHDMVGFNAFDVSQYTDLFTNYEYKDSGYRCRSIKLVPNQTYCVSANGANATEPIILINNDSHVNETGFADLRNGTERKLLNTGNDGLLYIGVHEMVGAPTEAVVANRLESLNITINLSWDGERDGEYEAYVKHSYPLDSSLTLRGIPKLDASNNLYYDGDTYESDGTVTRKYGIVDLGSLNWSRNATNQFYAPLPTAGTQYTGNQICTKYQASARGAYDANVDKCVTVTGTNCWIRDSAYDVSADFKTAMSGVYLVYELATPTTETADPYTNPQIVNDFGTEEYVDYAVSQSTRDVAIPVGHQTQYMANLKAKLEMSPSSPEGAGDYIVRQTNGENEYVTLASNATIQNIIARLEALEGQNAES